MDEQITKDVSKGIRDSIGRKMAITLKKMVKLVKGDKEELKVLTITPYRLLILGSKQPFKTESDTHFLNIKSMDSPSADKLHINLVSGKKFVMHMLGTEDAEHIIGRVALSIRTVFPSVSLSRIMKASLEPLSRQKIIQTMLNQANQQEIGPCGNFTEMYQCMCSYLGYQMRDEVAWDVDTIYLSQNCKVLNLMDFELVDQKDYIPILSVLKYNQWFTGLTVQNIRLSNDVLDTIIKVIRQSDCLTSLTLEGVGLKGEFAQKLSECLIENHECKISHINLTNNPLEDKSVLQLGNAFALVRGASIASLNLSKTGLTTKSIGSLCHSLRSRPSIGQSLKDLNLSDNIIKGEDCQEVYHFLASSNSLEVLDLSGTECPVEFYISALSKGGIKHLKTLNLSRNIFLSKGQKHPNFMSEEYKGARRNKETLPPSFQDFFASTTALEHLDLSETKVPPDAIKHIMEGLAMNTCDTLQVDINLSSCELKASGGQMIGTCVGNLHNLVSLDLSDNNLDAEMPMLLTWIQQNRSIRNLKIGRNFTSIKPKNMRNVMDCIVKLIQEDGSCLEYLSIADSKLKEHTNILLSCLGSNTSLTKLDISGNMIGDIGARNLAKSLQTNAKLRILYIDQNHLTIQGFNDIALAMEKNYSLRYMPFPVSDVVASMKQHPDRTQYLMTKIQNMLLRNNSDNKSTNDQQFRMQHAMSGTGLQIVDKLASKVDDAVVAMELLDPAMKQNKEIMEGKKLVKDAQKSKQLLSDMYGIGVEKTAGDESPLNVKLHKMAREMDAMVEEHVRSTVEAMTECAKTHCPTAFKSIEDDLERVIKSKGRLPQKYVCDQVINQAGREINNRVSDLNLVLATIISDKVTDTLLEQLSQTNLNLTEKLNQQKIQSPSRNARSKIEKQVTPSGTDSEEEPVEKLPNIRKQRADSIAKRKQRPSITLSPEVEDRPIVPPETSPTTKIIPSVVEEVDSNKNGVDFLERRESPEPVYAKINKESKKSPRPSSSDESHSNDDFKVLEVDEKIDDKDKNGTVITDAKSEDEAALSSDDKMDELPELSSAENAKKLEHVTKGRARGPGTRRNRGRPTKPKPAEENDETVDEFFSTSVTTTNFDDVPTLEQEKKIAAKEKAEVKKVPRKMPGMPGMPLVTPDMLAKKSSLKRDTKPPAEEKEIDKEEEPSEPAAEVEEEAPPVRKKPPGAMGLPGMGFGGNVLAEMKLKKLKNQPTDKPDANKPKQENESTTTDNNTSPFGPRMLKKTPKSPLNTNTNNNNNSTPQSPTSPTNIWKNKSLERKSVESADKPTSHESQQEPTSKKQKVTSPSSSIKAPSSNTDSKLPPLMPPKPKSASLKGAPPPLPTKPKPKPAIFAARQRPMSEFIPSDRNSSVKNRINSWGKTKAKEDEDK